MQAVRNAVIAVAGLGSRLGTGKPKCLTEVNGASIISYALALLKPVENLHVVVGFMEDDVMREVKRLRPGTVFVRNPNYMNTDSVYSYALGGRHLKGHTLYFDGDILFDPVSFNEFCQGCVEKDCLTMGYTDAKTLDAVYVELDGGAGTVTAFSREKKTPFEWANIVYAPQGHFEGRHGSVFQHLQKEAPLRSLHINSYEIDRPEELAGGEEFVKRFVSNPSRL